MKDDLLDRIELFQKDVLTKYPQLHIWISRSSEGSYYINHDNEQLEYQDTDFNDFVGKLYYSYFKDDDLFDVSFGYEIQEANAIEMNTARYFEINKMNHIDKVGEE